jgi:hypothetical protein
LGILKIMASGDLLKEKRINGHVPNAVVQFASIKDIVQDVE